MGSEGFYKPEIRVESDDKIGAIQWPTRPDLPPIKRPHLKVPRRRPNKIGPVASSETNPSVDSSKPSSRVVPPKKQHSWFKRTFCGCCIVPELGGPVLLETRIWIAFTDTSASVSETQRDIIANDSVYNNKFNYAVSFAPKVFSIKYFQ